MKRLLLAKHWQLFLAISLLYFVGKAIAISLLSRDLKSYAAINTIVDLSVASLILLWVWAISTHFCGFVNTRGWSIVRFKLCFFVFVVLFGAVKFLSLIGIGYHPLVNLVPFLLLIYCYAHASICLKSFELKTRASINEYALDIVLILVFPVGVWFIQPRVNKAVMS
ncbi:MAG: hypothetical protein ACK5QG_16500 [Bacteroidota bacterium]|jgi:hypothetical protein